LYKNFIFTAVQKNCTGMLAAVLSGFVFAFALRFLGRYMRGRRAALATILPLSLFAYFASLLPQVGRGEAVTEVWEWAPSFGVALSFRADGLALLFALIITGIGTLIYWYTSEYLREHRDLNRFFAYLSIFMGAMLGMVLSDDLIALFLFWELTSISSFFLIGFKNEEAASRRAALTALTITGMGGLLLLAAAVLIGQAAGGEYSLQAIREGGLSLPAHPWYGAILFLVFGAAFTKSAQFPFHFWLPGAMKAPSPVSAYLHSATMVKAGVYLLFRLSPLLGGHDYWHIPLMVVGAVTMVYAGVNLLFRTDLKGILAYSTVAALGILVMLIGVGTAEALLAALVFVLAHALYKAPLFLMTGIIDHSTGTRDVTRLAGLRSVMWPVAIAGGLAALSNAGFPLSFGFIGKDLIYEATLHSGWGAYWLTGAAVLTGILLFYGGFISGVKPFIGALPESLKDAHLPAPALWIPPLLAAVAGIFFGLFPGVAGHAIIEPALQGLAPGAKAHLAIWHGFNTVLLLSGITLAAGAALYYFFKPSSGKEAFLERLEGISPKGIAERLANVVIALFRILTRLLQNGYLRYYLLVILVFTIGLIGYGLYSGGPIRVDLSLMTELVGYEIALLGIMLVSILFTVFTQSRLAAVAAMGVTGYALCLFFVFYSAPDLAMTQFTIDTLTVILFVLVLYRLPRYLPISSLRSRLRDGAVALAFGGMITMLALAVLNEPMTPETSAYYAENAYALAKGKNIVNVILVDFRGADTLVEISVLTIAAIGVYSLLKLKPTND
jgi:multicomponent Na+:H+ antiporter subunit A